MPKYSFLANLSIIEFERARLINLVLTLIRLLHQDRSGEGRAGQESHCKTTSLSKMQSVSSSSLSRISGNPVGVPLQKRARMISRRPYLEKVREPVIYLTLFINFPSYFHPQQQPFQSDAAAAVVVVSTSLMLGRFCMEDSSESVLLCHQGCTFSTRVAT